MTARVDEYEPNLLHEWFPPKTFREWHSHQLRALIRLILFVFVTLAVLSAIAWYLCNLIFQEVRWSLLAPAVVSAILAILSTLILSGEFVDKVHGLSNWRRGLGYALLCLFGRRWPFHYPFVIVMEGKVREDDRDKYLADRRLGGPGQMIIFNDSAVILERYGCISRVEGPGAIFVERSERIREIVDLRPQVRTVTGEQTKMYTREGLAVMADITVRFQIKRVTERSLKSSQVEHQPPPDSQPRTSQELPHTLNPVSYKALLEAAKAQAVRIGGAKVDVSDWRNRVMAVVASTLRDIVADKSFDDLFESADPVRNPREDIRREMARRLQSKVNRYGVQVLDVMLEPFKPVHAEVERQRLMSWLAIQQAGARVQQAEGEAQALIMRESARTYARMDMMLNIASGLRSLMQRGGNLTSYFVAMQFIETMRQAADTSEVGLFLPKEALGTMESLQRLLKP
jgi:regulator of protease activity HflC (stomatin/prohibitin superfamily)